MADEPRPVTVLLTYDFDALSGWVDGGATSLGHMSRGEFGVVGVERLLSLMEDLSVASTFFIPGHTAETFPQTVRDIRQGGHEIGAHGWMHENPATLDEDEERMILERSIRSLEETAQVRPYGHRAPYWDLSANSTKLLVEYGFVYDSSLMGDDFSPYWARSGDRLAMDGPYEFGENVDLVELPVAWHLDDVPLFDIVLTDAASFTGLRPPSEVYEIWRAEFDFLYKNLASGMLNLTMHPQVIGRGHRLVMLRDLVEYMLGHPGVQFQTCLEFARDWRSRQTT